MCMQDKIIYSNKEIKASIFRLANELRNKFVFENPMYVCVMDGAVQFFTHLTALLPSGNCVYVNASRYDNAQSGGPLKFELPACTDCNPSIIFVIDDIVDQGITMYSLCNVFVDKFPDATIVPVCLINRNRPDKVSDFEPFAAIQTTSNAFFAGFGMDNKGYDRNLTYIYDCTEAESSNNITTDDKTKE